MRGAHAARQCPDHAGACMRACRPAGAGAPARCQHEDEARPAGRPGPGQGPHAHLLRAVQARAAPLPAFSQTPTLPGTRLRRVHGDGACHHPPCSDVELARLRASAGCDCMARPAAGARPRGWRPRSRTSRSTAAAATSPSSTPGMWAAGTSLSSSRRALLRVAALLMPAGCRAEGAAGAVAPSFTRRERAASKSSRTNPICGAHCSL